MLASSMLRATTVAGFGLPAQPNELKVPVAGAKVMMPICPRPASARWNREIG